MSANTPDLHINSGIRLPKDACVVIVRTAWNGDTVDKLQAGCVQVLESSNIVYRILEVPGAIEIPFAIKKYWEQHKYKDNRPHAFIALGCVLRGDTPHFEYVCQSVTIGITHLNLSIPVPTIFGILTVDNQKQIDERTGGKHGHKGKEAAHTALQMIALVNGFK
jgi:6,7-dimethyl-8-ribityllumazine synthase